MTDLLAANSNHALTMSSREIAEYTGKEHYNVIRDVEKMLDELEIDRLKFEGIFKDTYGRDQKCYKLPKDLTLTLVAGYSVKLRKAIIDRWQELEEQAGAGFRVPQNFKEALLLAADQQQVIEDQQKVIEESKPAVAFVENYTRAQTGNLNFREVCRNLKANEREFKRFLIQRGVLADKNSIYPYKHHIEAGRFKVTEGLTDNGHAYRQARFTPKGFEWVSRLWAEELGRRALEEQGAA
ncbi:Rha family transcriptional regulator [Flexibacterium corallicola]|uniref:Rha family transcriptional regulator n=1 Tax=Flexibacterium corallicola TaxID=3037259 RepID=UPI00286ED4C4|nr:Rha family transcriptional regulator [Pseudovibrio sp. M1P-2-3]